jgi:hypothetical protein
MVPSAPALVAAALERKRRREIVIIMQSSIDRQNATGPADRPRRIM